GSKSARVFWWEEVDGFFVRRAAGCGKYGLYWALYGRRQRRYDSFRNEWDLCEALAPSDCPNEDDDYDGYGSDDDDFYHEQSNILVDCSQEVSPRSYGAVDDIAYSRFGYSPIGEVPDLPGTILWDRVCKFVGLGWDTGMMSQASKAPIGKFFSILQSAKRIQDISSEIYDLRQLDADVMTPFKYHLRRRFLTGRRQNTMCREYYMFHFDETKEVLLLSSSASTIQVLRHQWGCQPGQSIYDIIRELLDRGIAFNFAIPGPYRSLKAEPDPIHARIAGYRPKNYKPDHLDFVAYEWHRNAFLRSPRGRAACLMGGIVGRLARGIVPYEEVYRGPSEDVFEDGVNFQDSGQPSVTLWDDRLTSDELDLVCGVYRIDTGMLIFYYSILYLKSFFRTAWAI
ncbi:hypothetical protein IW262DRAFT_1282307, partial [Armillaria fumosa]